MNRCQLGGGSVVAFKLAGMRRTPHGAYHGHEFPKPHALLIAAQFDSTSEPRGRHSQRSDVGGSGSAVDRYHHMSTVSVNRTGRGMHEDGRQ